jgi:tetratricopeptide (TPR) repeat protein
MPIGDDLPTRFDLFISYAHADDRDKDHRKVTALVEAIQADYLRVAGTPLKVFFDVEEIRAMDDWESRILLGLRQSRMMVAVLSPAYFASAYCKKEWEYYVETELAHSLPGDGIAPIYVVQHPGFDADPVDEKLKHWIGDLRRRQYINWRDFWPHGAAALEREDVRQKLDALPGQIAERLERASARDRSPNTVPAPSSKFVGRRDEMHALLKGLLDANIGAITAVNGIPGIGKSMLAFAYAWGYGFKYPGGRFLIQAANLADLASGVIALAEPKGVTLTDQERQQPEIALARVKKAFEDGPPALLVVDNLDDPALLGPQSRARSLPQGSHIHVLVTTRVSPEDLPKIHCLPLDALEPSDAVALLHGFRPIADAPQDDEWKAALEIANRLGGHALALEVVGVYLRDNPEILYRDFASSLEQEGIAIIEEEAGPHVKPEQKWHAESCIARLLEPTLASLAPEQLRAVEYAALLPPDNVPLPWLRDLLVAEFPDLAISRIKGQDKVQTLFNRLERLRLVVPLAKDRGSNPTNPVNPAETHLARMHRLVQDVVQRRVGLDRKTSLETVVDQFASDRAEWMNGQWGQPGLAWELSPLRDMATRMMDRGDRKGTLLVNKISTPLIHTGRMIDARSLWRKVEGLHKQLLAAAPENALYAISLSISYERLGDLAKESGEEIATRRYYEDSLVIRRQLRESAPTRADYALALCVGYSRLGDLAKTDGDMTVARQYYQNGLVIAKCLSEAVPEDVDYARNLCVSYDRLGDLAKADGDVTMAEQYYKDCLGIVKRLTQLAPENTQYHRDLSMGYNQLGDLALFCGDGIGARLYYEDSRSIAKRLSEAAPENADYARDLSVSYNKLGDLAKADGEVDVARQYYEDCLVIAKRLSEAAPESVEYNHNLCVSYNKLGDLAKADGDGTAGRQYYQSSLSILRRLSEAAPGNVGYARDLFTSYIRMGDLALSCGDGIGARLYYEDSRSIAKRLSEAAPENADYSRDLSVSYNKLGDLAKTDGEVDVARQYYEEDLRIAKRLSEAAPENAGYARDLWVSCWKIAQLLDQIEGDEALIWWRRSWEILSGMKSRGMFISPGDEKGIEYMNKRFRFGP